MESQLHFALVQADCEWENPSANCKRIESLLQALDKAVDIVVLPEMFASGFSMNPEKFASTMDGL